MNERYGKHTAPSGKTRRSAASAKPKRAEATGSGGKKSSSASGSKVKSAASRKPPLIVHPATAEYRRWRTIWWILLVTPLAITLSAWVPISSGNRPVAYAMLAVAYAGIFGALAIDWLKLRKLRQEWTEGGGAAQAGKSAAKSDESGKQSDRPEKGSTE